MNVDTHILRAGKAGFRPRLLDCLRGYRASNFSADLLAGLTVGIIALSLSMALGIASDRSPGVGVTTAIVAGFLISALGGSRVQIGGPTAAFIPVVVGVMSTYGLDNLIVCTALAGLLLIGMGVARMGVMIKYIPFPVIAGFTAGIAVYILSTQLKDFFGLNIPGNVPADFIPKILIIGRHLETTHWPAFLLATASLGLIKFWPQAWAKRVPASIVVVVLGTVLVGLIQHFTGEAMVETIGSRFGVDALATALPAPRLPQIDWSQIHNLVRPAFTIALLAAIESLLCAVVADGMIEDKHDSNTELIAQGIANIGSAMVGGLPATGALARTAANIRSGGRTPVAGIVHALTILVLIIVAAPLVKFIPLAVLSSVLVVVGLNMGEWENFARLPRWPKSDAAVFLITFALTVLTDLTVAIEVGMVFAAMLFIMRISETTKIVGGEERTIEIAPEDSLVGKEVPQGVLVYQMFGAFLFGAADKLETVLSRSGAAPRVFILGMKQVMAMDATGLRALEEFHARLLRRGQTLLLAGPHTQPLMMMTKDGFLERLGLENACGSIDEALKRARVISQAPLKS